MKNNDLILQKLSKSYHGQVVFSDLSLALSPGNAYCLMAPSGTGKTTLFRVLTSFRMLTSKNILTANLKICSGDILVSDSSNKKELVGRKNYQIGYLPQKFGCMPQLTVKEQLQYFCYLKKIPASEEKYEISRVLDAVRMSEFANQKCKKLSGGMVRRVGIAQAILGKPQFILLDEPTTGLDPATRKQVWNSVESLQCEDQVTVFLTTHYMEEAAAAGHIAIIDKGKLCEFGTPQELKMRYAKDTLTLYYKQEKHTLTSDNEKIYDTIPITAKSEIRVLENSMEAIPILNQLSDQLEGFELQQGTMDDVFLAVTGKSLKGGNI